MVSLCNHSLQDRKNALAGIDILRKICNHPDLLQRKQWESMDKYGDPVRSGKLTVAMKVPLPLHLPKPIMKQLSRVWKPFCSTFLTGALRAASSGTFQALLARKQHHLGA